ncbi:hypothetical protein QOT17_016749 [Balamuthia mandrillaris]
MTNKATPSTPATAPSYTWTFWPERSLATSLCRPTVTKDNPQLRTTAKCCSSLRILWIWWTYPRERRNGRIGLSLIGNFQAPLSLSVRLPPCILSTCASSVVLVVLLRPFASSFETLIKNINWSVLCSLCLTSFGLPVDGLIYVLNSDAELVVYDFELEEQARNNATAEIWGGGNFVEFVTPATDGKGVFYFVTETPEADAKALAIRFPENEVVWSRKTGEGSPFSVADYVAGGSPSLSEDGSLLFAVFERGGVMALNTENGEVEWATSITDLQEGDYYNAKQVPTISPVDGSIITHWRERTNESLVVVALSAETGEQVNYLQTLNGQITSFPWAPGASSVDGVYYASVFGHIVAVDLQEFEVLWNFTVWRDQVEDQSPSIAVDGSVYFPLPDGLFVLRCKENYALNANGECSEECAHPKARFVGRNMCGYDCGSSTALLHPLLAEQAVCHECEANQYWSAEELLCLSCADGWGSPAGSVGEDACVPEDASSSTEDGADSGNSNLLSFYLLS